MTDTIASPVDLSAEAVLELEELKQGLRPSAPALAALFHFLRTPAPSAMFQGQSGVSMLADVRSYAVLRDAIGQAKLKTSSLAEFRKIIERYLIELEEGVRNNDKETIQEAKRFCTSLTDNLLIRQMSEIYDHRETNDFRYVNNDTIS